MTFRVDPFPDSAGTPFRQRRKSDIHELLPEMFARSDSCKFTELSDNTSISNIYKLDSPFYQIGPKSVTRCTHILTGESYILKCRARELSVDSDSERIWRTVMGKILGMAPHPNIVRIHEVLEDKSNFYVVMEECTGGQLFDYLLKESHMTQKACKKTIREVLSAIAHLHEAGLIHRDVKPENIIFSNTNYTDETNHLKLIDFDTCAELTATGRTSSTNYSPTRRLCRRSSRVIGTLGYIAPESYNGDYSISSDLFSAGVIFYILMTGDMPFDDAIYSAAIEGDPDEALQQVGSPKANRIRDSLLHAAVDWEINPWTQIPLARDLCQRLIATNPEGRFASAREALSHPWLNSQSAAASPTKSRAPDFL